LELGALKAYSTMLGPVLAGGGGRAVGWTTWYCAACWARRAASDSMVSREATASKSCSSEMPVPAVVGTEGLAVGTAPTRTGAAFDGEASTPVERMVFTSPATPLEATETRPPGAGAIMPGAGGTPKVAVGTGGPPATPMPTAASSLLAMPPSGTAAAEGGRP
jgi:hypothetical protein